MSIELDTVTFPDNFAKKKGGSTASYSLLSKLGDQSIPLEMVYNDTKISGYENLANKFNGFLISMYSASTATDLVFSEREFISVSFDLDNVSEELMNASLGAGIELIPGLLLRHLFSFLSCIETVRSNCRILCLPSVMETGRYYTFLKIWE